MLFSSWLRNGNRPAPAARRRTQPSLRQRASCRPRLEALEDRLTPSSAIVQTNLVSDNTQVTQAQVQDPNLVNPWGLSASPTGEWWVANQGTGTSTLYQTSTSSVTPLSLVVGVPPKSTASPHGTPTGTVFNTSGTGFNVSENGNTPRSSIFLFDSVDGTISGWNPKVDLNNAIIEATNPGAVYLGLAIATHRGDTMLYASNFAGGIDVYDQNFQLVTPAPGSFTDPQLPADYHPFNIQAINNQLYVEYAPLHKVLGGAADPGDGAVDVYNAAGQLQQRLILPGDTHLNDPWAVAMAPGNFGSFSNDLLVGNFGAGTINAYNPHNGRFEGELNDSNGQPIAITHLWALAFGNGGLAGPTNTLYFTAGLTSNLQGIPPFHGLFGSLQVADNQGPHAATSIRSASITSSPIMSSPNGMTLAATDASGNPATGYLGTVHLSSSDSAATLPANYTFTASDAGMRTLVNPVILRKKGQQTLAVTDTQNSPLTATDSISV
jgi:uncharacterized protein (TIGR03118 family)